MARKSDLQRNIEGAKSRLESAKEGKYYDVASKTVKTHKDEKKKKKTIKTAEASLKSYDARNRSQTYREGGKVVDVTDVVKATSERQRNKKAISEHLKKLKRTGRDTLKTAQGETRADYWEKQQKYDQGALKETVKEQKKKILKGKK